MSNIGRIIKKAYCYQFNNSNALGAIIIAEGYNWIVISNSMDEVDFAKFNTKEDKDKEVEEFCNSIQAPY